MTEIKTITIDHSGQKYALEYFKRSGKGATILFLHGLGGAKENFEWATKHHALNDYTIISFDNPGTGNSSYHKESLLNIDDLTEITTQFIEKIIDGKFFLAGASMGGLTLLKYLENNPNPNILGLINIEGNLMMEDCMFSSQVIDYKYDEFESEGFHQCIADMRKNPTCGYHTIANNLALNTNIAAYFDYSFQTVEYSKSGDLYKAFVALDYPKLFLHGDANSGLSYIPSLKKTNVKVVEISHSDHFLFYDNPVELYNVIAEFTNQNLL